MKLPSSLRSVLAPAWVASAVLVSMSPASSPLLADEGGGGPATVSVSVFATGLNNPRGLKFGPDGSLYVAEGGTGGTGSTVGLCEQVVPPIGPCTGSLHGSRISKIDRAGHRTTVADNLPSSQTSAGSGSLVSGVSDVAFVEDRLYALLAGAGCSHGVDGVPNGVIRVHDDGTWNVVADLGAFYKANPVKHPEPDDFEPDGTPYSMVAVRGELFVVEPNHGELDRVTTDGRITRVVDISASQGHIVPTAVAFRGSFFVGNLNPFPIVEKSSKILRITPSGEIKVVVEGLTTVVGVAFDHRGRMYVLENTTGNPFPTPMTGRVVRVGPSNSLEVVADHLFLPTAMTFGPDESLYVSNVGFGPPPIGMGQILKIEMED